MEPGARQLCEALAGSAIACVLWLCCSMTVLCLLMLCLCCTRAVLAHVVLVSDACCTRVGVSSLPSSHPPFLRTPPLSAPPDFPLRADCRRLFFDETLTKLVSKGVPVRGWSGGGARLRLDPAPKQHVRAERGSPLRRTRR